MKRLKRCIGWLCLVLVFSHGARAKPTAINAVYQAQMTELLTLLTEKTGVPSLSVAVMHKGNVVASVTTGYNDRRARQKANDKTLYRLASVSKVIGATMLASIIDRRRLNPDSPIVQFIPDIDSRYANITLRQLVSHTSGMPHYQLKDHDIYDTHYTSAMDALVTLKSRALLSKPGDDYHYSTHGYTLIGAVYEALSNAPLALAIPEFLASWSKKKTPMIEDINRLPSEASPLYEFTGGKIKLVRHGEKSYSVFGAGLIATAEDLAAFGDMTLQRAPTGSTLSNLLFTPSTDNEGRVVGSAKYNVGFGWRISHDHENRRVYHHAGATPGARSILALYPEEEVSIAILSNASWIASIDQLAFTLANLYLDNAKRLPLTADLNIQELFKGKEREGVLSCEAQRCELSVPKSDYTAWQSKYNRLVGDNLNWPIIHYGTNRGRRLLLVEKTGIRTLRQASANERYYQSNISEDSSYVLFLSNAAGSDLD